MTTAATTSAPVSVPMIERRAIEAELMLAIHRAAVAQAGPEKARAILEAAIDESARAAGRAFAASAPAESGGPSLAHFATVLERWSQGGVLVIEDVRLTASELTFRVTRCGYMERYAALGVPPELRAVFSCRRDQGFAEGYSANLRMLRPETIGEGGECCRFAFQWSG